MDKFLLRLIWLCLLGYSYLLHAQSAQIRGQVGDTIDRAPLGFATISLYRGQDSVPFRGMLADSLGRFSINKLTPGIYQLRVHFLGYKSLESKGIQLPKAAVFDLGFMGLQPSARLLQEIEITGQKSKSFHRVDRQVYQADQFENAQGGSAADLVRNLPGVSVDAQGHISLRGSQGFMLMIDGRQIQIDAASFLDQLPANAVEDIEILTTPSARYDPDGQAGIIHITTHTGAQEGLSWQVNVRLGAPSIEPYGNAAASRRYGTDATLNLRREQWDLSMGLDYNRDDLAGRRVGYVNTFQESVLTEFPSSGERSFDRFRYSGRISLQWRPKKGQQVGLRLLGGDRTQSRTADILYAPQQRTIIPAEAFLGPEAYWNLYQETGTVFQGGSLQDSLTYYNENLRLREGDFLIGGLDYEWKLNSLNTLQFAALYERTLLGGPTDNAVLAWPNLADTLQYQYNTNRNPLDGLRIKADFTHKTAHQSWESGYQFRFLHHPGDFTYLDRDLTKMQWEVNPLFSNQIVLRRKIHALYSQLSGSRKKWNYSVGLRLEYMDRQVELGTPDTTFPYRILQPFPSARVQYQIKKDWLIKAGYSRRIERTTTFKMTPFPEREHNETLEQGDAELLPEFIDVVEVGTVNSWGDNSLFVTAYYRRIQNVINRVNSIFNDSVLNRIYTNAGLGQAVGLEIGSQLYPAEWCRLALGANMYQYQIKGKLFGEAVNNTNLTYSLNTQAEFKLSPTLSIQAAFNYLSNRITAQGIDSRYYNPALTISKSFWGGKIKASLQWQSIDLGLLESNEQRITTVRSQFYTTTNYIYEVDRVLISLRYQFNQGDKSGKFIQSEFGDKEF